MRYGDQNRLSSIEPGRWKGSQRPFCIGDQTLGAMRKGKQGRDGSQANRRLPSNQNLANAGFSFQRDRQRAFRSKNNNAVFRSLFRVLHNG
jgi:hypothetical protein